MPPDPRPPGPALRDHQRAFAQDLLGRTSPPDLPPLTPLSRLAIHRATVRDGLAAALAGTFPVVERLLGAAAFLSLARRFVAASPPGEAPLLRYGADFPAFIIRERLPAALPCLAALPYLGDVARLEVARAQAFHAPEAPVLLPADLAALLNAGEHEEGGVAGGVESLRLVLHPSCRFVVSPYPVDRIWDASQDGADPAPGPTVAAPGEERRLLVLRPAATVVVLPVDGGTLSFLMAVSAGQPLAAAWQSGRRLDPGFDLSSALARCLSAGVFRGPDAPPPTLPMIP